PPVLLLEVEGAEQPTAVERMRMTRRPEDAAVAVVVAVAHFRCRWRATPSRVVVAGAHRTYPWAWDLLTSSAMPLCCVILGSTVQWNWKLSIPTAARKTATTN